MGFVTIGLAAAGGEEEKCPLAVVCLPALQIFLEGFQMNLSGLQFYLEAFWLPQVRALSV